MRIIYWLAIGVLDISGALGQTVPNPPSFEFTDVHTIPHLPDSAIRGGLTQRGIYQLRSASMADLISLAYEVEIAKIAGGPHWLEWDRFDVIAVVPAGATIDTVRPMLRTLLADRFGLVVHNGTASTPAFVLTAGSNPLLKPASGTEESGCRQQPESPALVIETLPVYSFVCTNMTMGALATAMPDMKSLHQYTDYLRVVDQTGLKGAWNFSFKYMPRAMNAQNVPVYLKHGLALPTALSTQLGLELNRGAARGPVLVVDRVNQTPAANPPGTAKALPQPPTEFEVASLRPSAPGASPTKTRIENGRVEIRGSHLSSLVYLAWHTENYDDLAGMPKWAENTRFDIVAKSSVDPNPAGQKGINPDTDATYTMIRNLLTDRFQIKTHEEQREMRAAVLLRSGKLKMKRSNAATRTKCNTGVGADGKDPRDRNPAAIHLLTCTNVTMAQFSEMLFRYGGRYVPTLIQDKTGLEGGWDFTLNYGSSRYVLGDDDGPADGASSAARTPDLSGWVSLYDALKNQLGLKLVLQKRPASVLVIDHIDETPKDN